MGDYDQAKKYFLQAYQLFPRYVFYWRHPIVESGLSLLAMRENKEEEAIRFLDDALQKLGNMNNPREAGYVYMAIALLKKQYPDSRIAQHYEGTVLSYGTRALQELDLSGYLGTGPNGKIVLIASAGAVCRQILRQNTASWPGAKIFSA